MLENVYDDSLTIMAYLFNLFLSSYNTPNTPD